MTYSHLEHVKQALLSWRIQRAVDRMRRSMIAFGEVTGEAARSLKDMTAAWRKVEKGLTPKKRSR